MNDLTWPSSMSTRSQAPVRGAGAAWVAHVMVPLAGVGFDPALVEMERFAIQVIRPGW